ncbi:poly-gamma-glutamate hydrolase family protein [Alkalicoccobacillus plakortidis]|uniref:Poly-gamma-glutamate hydrolase family protein n=1 Tax=Alkalicoccobacillus plakortidis TaxID=444060 RepID=A0ABT0XMZ2_9BACI|nr:poly-gamma-glutamate hydrolase family protein [Alkalicoccobacillus plakortidis]MCM2676602.1 poly-gamma-glutamate hydrolase family protein [Alkalicoccobacillus plakortidis]
MNDLYQNIEELKRDNEIGRDYQIRYQTKQSTILFKAIHGGGIEPGTSELAEYSAADRDSFYCFEGIRSSGNANLHITSVHFDEPQCLDLVAASSYTISYHGYSGGSEMNTIVGGLDYKLRAAIAEELLAAGFQAEEAIAAHQIGGSHPENIVNKNQRGKGVQLEISYQQRLLLFERFTAPGRRETKNELFSKYVAAVLRAVDRFV